MVVLEVISSSSPKRTTRWLNAAWLRFLSMNATAAMIVGRVKGTADISGRDFLEMVRKRVQAAHRRGKIRLVPIDHVTLKRGVTVHEHLVLWNALDRAQRLPERVLLPCREIV